MKFWLRKHEEGELEPLATIKNSLTVQIEVGRQVKLQAYEQK